MFSSVFSFNFCHKFSWTKKFVSFQKFASSDKSERPAHQPEEFGLLLFVLFFFYCGSAARRERFTQLRRPVIIFNAEEQEHDKFIKSTSFDETFTPHASNKTIVLVFPPPLLSSFFCYYSTSKLPSNKNKREKRRKKETFYLVDFTFFSFLEKNQQQKNSTRKSNLPDRKFNGNSSRRFTYTGACYVLGKLFAFFFQLIIVSQTTK